MNEVRVLITKWVSDEPHPGVVECELVDIHDRVWRVSAIWPKLSTEALSPTSKYPRPGAIACEIVEQRRHASGHGIVTIDTREGAGVEFDGSHRFEVWSTIVSERVANWGEEAFGVDLSTSLGALTIGGMPKGDANALEVPVSERAEQPATLIRDDRDWTTTPVSAYEGPVGRAPVVPTTFPMRHEKAFLSAVVVWMVAGGLLLMFGFVTQRRLETSLGAIATALTLVFGAACMGVATWEGFRLRRRKRQNLCIECGFPRRGLAELQPCPECGARSWEA